MNDTFGVYSFGVWHYRICCTSKCESECRDGVGNSPCSVLAPVDTNYDRVIGQWGDNEISNLDTEKARLVYGVKKAARRERIDSSR